MSDEKFKVDWRTIAVHDEKNIKGFFGPYRCLSNFSDQKTKEIVEFEGLYYPWRECAYQAAKVAPNKRAPFQTCSSYESKHLWKKIGTIYKESDWNIKREEVMQRVVFNAMLLNKHLRDLLLSTGDKYIEETNWWKDVYFGVCNGTGENKLGKILMATRSYWQEYDRCNNFR